MSHDGKREISLEDLLRMKRAECPPAEFWVRFDEELRAKQLAALVQRRAWWRRSPNWASLFCAFRVIRFPVGAIAVLAISFITVGETAWWGKPVSMPGADPSAPATSEPEEVAAPSKGLRRTDAASELAIIDSADVKEEDSGLRTAVSSGRSAAESVEVPTRLLARSLVDSDASPSGRSIAANLIVAEEVEPQLVRSYLGARPGGEHSILTMRTTVDPLQQMTHPSEIRLARYRSPLVASISSEGEDRTGERVARRLSDERLYEQVNRFGARGDRLHVRF